MVFLYVLIMDSVVERDAGEEISGELSLVLSVLLLREELVKCEEERGLPAHVTSPCAGGTSA